MAGIKVIIERAEANTAGYDLDTRPICLLHSLGAGTMVLSDQMSGLGRTQHIKNHSNLTKLPKAEEGLVYLFGTFATSGEAASCYVAALRRRRAAKLFIPNL